jgi:uncharacterized protein (TIGR03067 family)
MAKPSQFFCGLVILYVFSLSAGLAGPIKALGKTAPGQTDLEKMQGSWRFVSSQVADEKSDEEEVKRRVIIIEKDKLIYEYGNPQKEKREYKLNIDPKTQAMDWTFDGATMQGIYELKGDNLKIGFGNDSIVQVRPKKFVVGKEDVVWLLVLKRDHPE